MNLLRLFLFSFALILHQSIWADAEFKLDASQGHTSDDYQVNQLAINYFPERYDILWPYTNEKETSLNWDLSARFLNLSNTFESTKATHFSTGLLYKKTPSLSGRASLGLTHLHSTGKDDSIFFIGSLEVNFAKEQFSFFKLKIRKDFLQPSPIVVGVHDTDVYATVIEPIVLIEPHQRIKLQLKSQVAFLGDNNTRSVVDAEALWGMQLDPNWIWLGLGTEYLGNSHTNVNYWAPNRFYSWGVRLDSNIAVYEKWSFFAGGSLNQNKEENFENGTGHYVKTGFSYGKREEHTFKLYYEGNGTLRGTSKWIYEGLGVSLQLFW